MPKSECDFLNIINLMFRSKFMTERYRLLRTDIFIAIWLAIEFFNNFQLTRRSRINQS